jgi:transposase
MDRPKLEVADIFRRYGEAYREKHGGSMSTAQRRVMTAIEVCRTAALGRQIEQCDECGHQRICYRSCRNRHCPKCQSLARAEWIEHRQAELLDCEYYHVVFTVPNQIAAIAYQNKEVVYNILFQATAETLRTIAADPKHLGAEIGFFAVLHSWGSALLHHPHLHCVVPGGGLSPDGTRWVPCKPGFFLPVRVLSRLFRRLFLEHLQYAFDSGKLRFFTALESLRDRRAFVRYLEPLKKAKWVVYAKRPFAGSKQVLDYVGRYTHRVAISNNHLLDSRIVLLAAEGLQNEQIATRMDTAPRTVARWRDRFLKLGIPGLLKDAARPGRTPSIPATVVARVIEKTTQGSPANATHWSRSTMAREVGVSDSTVGRIWRANGLKPHRVDSFKVSNDLCDGLH